jgi:DNA polymerase I
MRCFSVVNVMNINGHHVGGLTGFLKSVGYAIKLIRPTRVILVFDGLGNSNNKKNLYSEYKGNRNVKRVTNWEGFDSKEEEADSMSAQISRLINYIEELPVDLLIIDKVEADDVMAYITHKMKSHDNHVTLMSSDQDFLQLVSRNISVYSPTKKKIYTPEKVKEEYEVPPCNFLTRKILLGDKSDNVVGVHGLGPKKLLKLFPELTYDTLFTLDDVYNKSLENNDQKLYSNIVAFKHQLNINKQLMDLHDPVIPQVDEIEIDEVIEGYPNKLNIGAFMKMCDEDSIQKAFPNIESWLNECFMGLNHYIKK